MIRRSIEYQLVFSVLVIVALLLGGCLAAFLFLLERNANERLSSALDSGREEVRQAVEERRSRAGLVAGLLAGSGEIADAAAAGSTDRLEEILDSYMGRLETDVISVISPDGVLLAQSEINPETGERRTRSGEPVFLNPLFPRAVMGLTPSGVELCMPDVVCVNAYSPLPSGAGYVRAGFFLDSGFAGEVKKSTGTDYMLVRRGRLVASSIPAGALAEDDMSRIEEAVAALADSRGDGPGDHNLRWLELGGTPYAFEAEPLLDASGRALAVNIRGRDTGDIRRVRRDGVRYILLIGAVALAFAVGFTLFTARRIFNPLRSLLQKVREITGGCTGAKIEHAGGDDEIGHLAGAFNEMSDALARRENSLREAADEIRVNQDQLIRSGRLAAIGELAAGVAHEIGNPLSAISGYAQLLAAGNTNDKKTREYAAEIEREAEFIEKIIQDLLEFSRPAKEESTEMVRISELLETAIRTASSHKAFSRVAIAKKFAPDIPPVPCNRKEIIQVFINLLVNAAQAMPEGGGITVTGELRPDCVAVRVRDEGPGIPEDLRRKIFDPFFTTKPTGVGTGLGLSICYRIIEKHHGSLTLEPTPTGTSFLFTLPTN